MTKKNNSTTWTSACKTYAGVLHDGPAGKYLILTQESQLALLKKNKEAINAQRIPPVSE